MARLPHEGSLPSDLPRRRGSRPDRRAHGPWCCQASRSRLAPFVQVAKTIRKHRDGILAAIRLEINENALLIWLRLGV